MKKLTTLILTIALLFGLTNCAEAPREEATSNEDEISEEIASETEETTSEEEEDTSEEEDVSETEEASETGETTSESEEDITEPEEVTEEKAPAFSESDYASNGAGNMANGGLVTASGDYIYYTGYSDDDDDKTQPALIKCKTDGSEKTKLYNGVSRCLSVVADTIYFNNEDDYICKIKTDGSDFETLTYANCHSLYVDGDRIYYHNSEDNFVYGINADGTENEIIISEYVFEMVAYNNWIYYTGYHEEYYSELDDFRAIYKVRSDGTDKTLMLEKYCFNLIISDELLYFIETDEYSWRKLGYYGNKIGAIPFDGEALPSARDYYKSDLPFWCINICEDWLYFSNENGRFCVPLNNYETFPPSIHYIDEANLSPIFIANGWIYYTFYIYENKIERISVDGSIIEKI